MPAILAISSQVASGHIGLSAIVPALQSLGRNVIALPTVLLSNHPAHPHCSGVRVDPAELEKMFAALQANGRLADVGTVLTGYLPTVGHVDFTCSAIRHLKKARQTADAPLRIICDPILGDDPKGLYIAEDAATAVRGRLLPLADAIMPNRFELSWLSGLPVNSMREAIAAARSLGRTVTLATSIPAPNPNSSFFSGPATGNSALATVLITSEAARTCLSPRHQLVPHGTGDLLSGLYAAETSLEAPALGIISARLQHVISESLGRPELSLISASQTWQGLAPLPVHEAL